MSQQTAFEAWRTKLDPYYVYILAHINEGKTALGPVKIGITNSPDGRLSTLQTANPHPIGFACLFMVPNKQGARALEKAMHKKFKNERAHGEWFNVGLLTAMESFCSLFDIFLRCGLDNDKITEAEAEEIRNFAGVYAAEQICIGARYLAAWESQTN